MGAEVTLSYKGPDGRSESSRADLLGANSLLGYRIYEDEPLARYPEDTILTDFIFLHRVRRNPNRTSMSRLPDVVTRKRWARVRVKERKVVGEANPLLLVLEPLSPEEDLSQS